MTKAASEAGPGAHDDPAQDPARGADGAVGASAIRLAMLDDDDTVRQAVSLVLEAAGLRVERFADIEAPEGADRQRPFDAYVLDWRLQGGTSEALIRRLLQREDTPPRIVVVLTAHVTSDGETADPALRRLIAEGVVRWRSKPCSARRLAAEIVQFVGARATGPSAGASAQAK